MTYVPDAALEHLRQVAAWPDTTGTRYRIEAELAAGGMGVVYRALDTVLERPVALKVLRESLSDATNMARLRREAHVIARLEHPGIIPVHDLGTLPDGRLYYVMKLVQGQPLNEYFTAGDDWTKRVRLFERVCETVAFAHAQGVIHRDLKPQNVMVGAFGEVLVLDWGVAKVRWAAESERGTARLSAPGTEASTDDAERTRTQETAQGTILGTPAFMAPEQARGELERVDERSDVYALGALLCYLLTGQPPRRATADGESAAPPSPVLAARVPRTLAAVCLKALAAAPEERYRSAEALADDVRRVLSGQQVTAYRETPLEAAGRVAWKYRTAIGLVAAYAVMRAALAFWQRI